MGSGAQVQAELTLFFSLEKGRISEAISLALIPPREDPAQLTPPEASDLPDWLVNGLVTGGKLAAARLRLACARAGW